MRTESPDPTDTRDAAPGRKPAWLKKRLPDAEAMRRMDALLRERHLHTVCESALCPNQGECFARGTATFLIMGDVCTRDCRFCGVVSGRPGALDESEPAHVADAVSRLGLRHVVITSVTRDDLADGGAGHYVATIRAVRERVPEATIEVLTPDFQGNVKHLDQVLGEAPEVFNHNLETVPRLYETVRPQAVFERSIAVLRHAAKHRRGLVKTGWMVGLGERDEEVHMLLGAVAGVGVDVVTIGQYLRPSGKHIPVAEYVHPEVFERYGQWGEALGLQVHAAPFVRSSFQAGESFAQARLAQALRDRSLDSGAGVEIE
ncbi:MAG: lipoyl synthase [Thermoleophilia bacterium]|nr:lipoyl synthase [Thermoleophilia bacterium]